MDGADDEIQPQPADGLPSCLGGGGILHAHLRPPADGERGIIRQQGLKLPVPGGDVRRGQARAVEVHVVGEADLLQASGLGCLQLGPEGRGGIGGILAVHMIIQHRKASW